MTYEEVAQDMPHEFGLRRKDKLRYRCGTAAPALVAGRARSSRQCSAGGCRLDFWGQQQQVVSSGRLPAVLYRTRMCCTVLQVSQRRVLHGCHPAPGAGGNRWVWAGTWCWAGLAPPSPAAEPSCWLPAASPPPGLRLLLCFGDTPAAHFWLPPPHPPTHLRRAAASACRHLPPPQRWSARRSAW